MSRNKLNCCSMTFSWMVAPKGAVCVACLAVNLALQEFFQTINFHFSRTEHQPTRTSIPTHRCLQWRLRPVACKHIFPPRAIIYHKIREYSHGKWPTVSLFLTTFTANLLTVLSSSCCAWSVYPIAGFPNIFLDLTSPNIWIECKFLHAWTDSQTPPHI